MSCTVKFAVGNLRMYSLKIRQKAVIKKRKSLNQSARDGQTMERKMLSILLNCYIKGMLNNILEDNTGLRERKELIFIRFADDMIILANGIKELQRIITKLVKRMKEYGMRINVGKTNAMNNSANSLDRQIQKTSRIVRK